MRLRFHVWELIRRDTLSSNYITSEPFITIMNTSRQHARTQRCEDESNTGIYQAVTNIFSLTPSTTFFYDQLWKQPIIQKEDVSFIDNCQRLCYGTRFRKKMFDNLPNGMEVWPGWKEVHGRFKENLPEFHGMIEYVVRRIFKALFRRDSNVMFQWFIDRCAAKMRVTTVLIAAIKRCKRGSTERRALQAVLHSSFTREDLKCIMKDHENLFDGFEMEENPGRTSATNTAKQASSNQNVQGGGPVGNSNGPASKAPGGQNGNDDDEIIDAMSSDGNQSEGVNDEVHGRLFPQEDDEDLCGDLYVRSQIEEISSVNDTEHDQGRRICRGYEGSNDANRNTPESPDKRTDIGNFGEPCMVRRRLNMDSCADGNHSDQVSSLVLACNEDQCDDDNNECSAVHGDGVDNVDVVESESRIDNCPGREGIERMADAEDGNERTQMANRTTDIGTAAALDGNERQGEQPQEEEERRVLNISVATSRQSHNERSDDGTATDRVGSVGNEVTKASTEAGRQKEGKAGNSVYGKKSTNVYSNGISMWRHWHSRKDMAVMMQCGKVGQERKNRKCFEDQTLRETVRYILQGNNVQLLSWGTRKMFVNGQRRQFPVLVRRSSVDVMWRNYARERSRFPSGVKKVRRTVFCDIASKLTRGDTKQRACIDYKLHALVYQNINTLGRIIENHVRECDKRKELKTKMKGVSEFLKYSYITHLKEDSNDPFHNMKYALGHGKFNNEVQKGDCRECNAVFKFLRELKGEIIDSSPSLEKILINAAMKFEVFMGHMVRKNVQEAAISDVFQWVRDGRPNSRICVHIDFKMKVEPQRYRESTIQYYGKSGMSLHGSAVFYKPEKATDPDYC